MLTSTANLYLASRLLCCYASFVIFSQAHLPSASHHHVFFSFQFTFLFAFLSCFNPFAPGDFAEKRVLKLVEWFSGHCHVIKSRTYHKPVYRSYTSRPSDPDAKYQLAKFKHAQKAKFRDTAVLTFTFRFLSSLLFSLFLPHFFFLLLGI